MVLEAGFGSELLWQRDRPLETLTESGFLQETAWVVLSAGMREAIVRRKFPEIARCFLDWRSATEIVRRADDCVSRAICVFGHQPKVQAIAQAATILAAKGFESLLDDMTLDPVATLRQFPYIGPITVFHLAKNLGIPVAKPDRHLCRMAHALGFRSPHALCAEIAAFVGDPVGVVDIVLWRYATLSRALRRDSCGELA